ncbi:amidase signature enzyme [Cadophora sp. DSE1049]|nr:amidase signature enzyme [Cadophora sp. DSE1049]
MVTQTNGMLSSGGGRRKSHGKTVVFILSGIPGGSSSGSAAAVASYEWLDFALGTDTTGSAKIPAMLNGCFSLRPTVGAVSTEGIVATDPAFDVPALFGRDLSLFQTFASAWYSLPETETSPSKPVAVLFPPDFYPTNNTKQMKLLESFASDLATMLGTSVQRMSIADAWTKTTSVEEKGLKQYLYNSTAHSFYYSAYHSFDDFRTSYKESFEKNPFITEYVRWIWNIGLQVTPSEHSEMVSRLKIFKTWFLRHYMDSEKQTAIVLLPVDEVHPNYRDQYPSLPVAPVLGLRTTCLSPFLGAPELTIPISSLPFQSRLSNITEVLPVVMSLMGAPGTDFELIEMALRCLQETGRPFKVNTGGRMFTTPVQMEW